MSIHIYCAKLKCPRCHPEEKGWEEEIDSITETMNGIQVIEAKLVKEIVSTALTKQKQQFLTMIDETITGKAFETNETLYRLKKRVEGEII